MTKPVIAAKHPAKTKINKGKNYFWCRCGRSNKQPFCDGAHKGTGITPIKFTADTDKEVFLCQCKATNKKPFCDGNHTKLIGQNIGDAIPAN